MLVDIRATKMKDIPEVVELRRFIVDNSTRWAVSRGNQRYIDKVITLARKTLLAVINDKSNRRGRVTIESVYKETDTHTLIGAIVSSATLKGSRDTTDMKSPQLHVDNQMVIFSFDIMCKNEDFINLDLQIPNDQEYKEFYFSPEIFSEYLDSLIQIYDLNNRISSEQALATLTLDLVKTGDILKSKKRMPIDVKETLGEYIFAYAVHLQHFKKGKAPTSYRLIPAWYEEALSKLGTEPHFMFRHIWRCYFTLAKEGYVL